MNHSTINVRAFSIILLVCSTFTAYSQAKRPTIMVVPSDVWCIQEGYFTTHNVNDVVVKIPDYKRALQESSDLLLVVSKINELMSNRGFPLKNLESSLKSLNNDEPEDALLVSKTGSNISETPIDKLKKVTNADIWLQITWTVNRVGPKQSITFNMQGLDAYTNKQVAGASGTGIPSYSVELAVLLEEAVVSHLDNFNSQLINHFDDVLNNGREIILRIIVWSDWNYDLESEDFGDDELGILIEDWVANSSKNARFSTSIATENMMLFEQVRIPIYYEYKGQERSLDARRWANGLRKYLKQEYQIESKLMMKGLGQAQLVIGGK